MLELPSGTASHGHQTHGSYGVPASTPPSSHRRRAERRGLGWRHFGPPQQLPVGHSATKGALGHTATKPLSAGQLSIQGILFQEPEALKHESLPPKPKSSLIVNNNISNQSMQSTCIITPDCLYQVVVWFHLLKLDLQPM